MNLKVYLVFCCCGLQYDVARASSIMQAQAVTPSGGTIVNSEDWDAFDDFTPDYDNFDRNITSSIAAMTNSNFLLSPLGLKTALAILAEASLRETHEELLSVLGFDSDRRFGRKKFASFITKPLQTSPETNLNLGSRLYIANRLKPRARFSAIAEVFYKTELRTGNFYKPEEAADEINEWVSNITAGRIPVLVNPDDIAINVILILNTLYFNGTWRHQFAPNATKNGTFYVTDTKQSNVPFMNTKDNFYYAESNKYDAKILRMPYRGNKFAMYIIVPNSISGLPRVLAGLSDLRLEIDNLSERLVEVTLPKFKFEYISHLDRSLRELGVRAAFREEASFPGISGGQLSGQNLRVSKVLQGSGIEVNELGTVAYTETDISPANKFEEDTKNHIKVVANKPFLFFIHDEPTRQILLIGRVSNPEKAKKWQDGF